MPLLVLLSLLGIAVFQIIPLPALFRSDFGGFDAVARDAVLMDSASSLHPISFDPNRTWNTIFALFVPIAVVCMYAIQARPYREFAALALVAIAGLSAIVGIAQALGLDAFYFYHITNTGSAVGLFANRNHQSIMLLWLMVAVCFYAGGSGVRHFPRQSWFGIAVAIVLALVPLLVLTGSRAGLVLSAPVLVACVWLLLRSGERGNSSSRKSMRTNVLLVLGVLLVLALIFGVLYFDSRNTAISRLFENDAVADKRFLFLPIFLTMVSDALPLGTGFGSFESVFRAYEPAGDLSILYMNQAHNDLLQLLIEGGIPALLLLLGGGAWLCWAVWRVWRSTDQGGRGAAFYLGVSISLWLAASLVDYPLRTPLAAMVAALLTAQLSFLSTRAPLKSDASICELRTETGLWFGSERSRNRD